MHIYCLRRRLACPLQIGPLLLATLVGMGAGCSAEKATEEADAAPSVDGELCGNGTIDTGEMCDDSENNSDTWSPAAHCNARCTGLAPHCGDGSADDDDGEFCDDGSGNSDAWGLLPHCNTTCTALAPYCGDGSTDDAEGEACDEGAENSDSWAPLEHCNATCSGAAPYCGDGTIDGDDGEACDDAAENNDAWAPLEHCNSTCSDTAPLCDLAEDTSVSFPLPGVPYPPENLHTQEKAILGKILFWEQQLSADDTVACGSCHQGSAGGSDQRAGLALHPGADGLDETGDDVLGSMGIRRCEMVAGVPTPKIDAIFGDKVQVTGRKTPSFLDAMFAASLFWDGRATDAFVAPDTDTLAIVTGGALESQALGPLLSPVEMSCEGRTFSDLYVKMATLVPLALASDLPPDMANALCKYPSYPQLFEVAFGDPAISAQRIAFAIATYERTLVSDRSPYDHFVDSVSPDPNALTAEQQAGLALFEGAAGCGDCHTVTRPNADAPAQFTDQQFHNLGFIDLASQTTPDLGLQNISGLAEDAGKFKTSTLRNVGLREPGGLLHTGLGSSLEDVMAAYNTPGVPPGPDSTTDPLMVPLGLSAADIAKIVDFMRNALTDPRVESESYPFDHPTLSVP